MIVSTSVGRGVAPAFPEADEAAGAFLKLMQDVLKVAAGPC
jgi:hypothetical protein